MKATLIVLEIRAFQLAVSMFMGKLIRVGRSLRCSNPTLQCHGFQVVASRPSVRPVKPALAEHQYEPRGASTLRTVRARM